MDLSKLQQEQGEWEKKNFDLSGEHTHRGLLGVMEEVGELTHAHLKHEQGIRGYDRAMYEHKASDAIGDIVIYLAGYCNRNGFNLQACVEEAWRQVSGRDWVNDPEKGGE